MPIANWSKKEKILDHYKVKSFHELPTSLLILGYDVDKTFRKKFVVCDLDDLNEAIKHPYPGHWYEYYHGVYHPYFDVDCQYNDPEASNCNPKQLCEVVAQVLDAAELPWFSIKVYDSSTDKKLSFHLHVDGVYFEDLPSCKTLAMLARQRQPKFDLAPYMTDGCFRMWNQTKYGILNLKKYVGRLFNKNVALGFPDMAYEEFDNPTLNPYDQLISSPPKPTEKKGQLILTVQEAPPMRQRQQPPPSSGNYWQPRECMPNTKGPLDNIFSVLLDRIPNGGLGQGNDMRFPIRCVLIVEEGKRGNFSAVQTYLHWMSNRADFERNKENIVNDFYETARRLALNPPDHNWSYKSLSKRVEELFPSDEAQPTVRRRHIEPTSQYYNMFEDPTEISTIDVRTLHHSLGLCPEHESNVYCSSDGYGKIITELNMVLANLKKDWLVKTPIHDTEKNETVVVWTPHPSSQFPLKDQEFYVCKGCDPEASPAKLNLSTIWKRSTLTNNYMTYDFKPGISRMITSSTKTFNMYAGIPHLDHLLRDPLDEVDTVLIQPILDHIKRMCWVPNNVVCRDSESNLLYDYILDSMAWRLRNLDQKFPKVFYVEGNQGTGKNAFADIFKYLFTPQYYLEVIGLNYLDKVFNASILGKLVVTVNEMVNQAAYKQVGSNNLNMAHLNGMVKSLGSDKKLTIEPKFHDAKPWDNYIQLILLSDQIGRFSMEAKARRELCLRATPPEFLPTNWKAEMERFYQTIRSQKAIDHFVQSLLNRNISQFDPHTLPKHSFRKDCIMNGWHVYTQKFVTYVKKLTLDKGMQPTQVNLDKSIKTKEVQTKTGVQIEQKEKPGFMCFLKQSMGKDKKRALDGDIIQRIIKSDLGVEFDQFQQVFILPGDFQAHLNFLLEETN